jgi:hypothetical protein
MPLVLQPVELLHVNFQLVTELNYDKDVLHGYVKQSLSRLNIRQETTVTAVFNAIAQGEGGVFFLDGPGGLGKTFVYNALLASVRWDEHVAIGVTSFDIAAFLLEGGRISHSVFKIPIALGKDSMCSIHVQSYSVELLHEAKLIVWDEVPSQH